MTALQQAEQEVTTMTTTLYASWNAAGRCIGVGIDPTLDIKRLRAQRPFHVDSGVTHYRLTPEEFSALLDAYEELNRVQEVEARSLREAAAASERLLKVLDERDQLKAAIDRLAQERFDDLAAAHNEHIVERDRLVTELGACVRTLERCSSNNNTALADERQKQIESAYALLKEIEKCEGTG